MVCSIARAGTVQHGQRQLPARRSALHGGDGGRGAGGLPPPAWDSARAAGSGSSAITAPSTRSGAGSAACSSSDSPATSRAGSRPSRSCSRRAARRSSTPTCWRASPWSPAPPAHRAIARALGERRSSADGTLDRAALRHVVFADPPELEALNAIVHPAVARLRDQALAAARTRGDRIVVCDIPLLFERKLAVDYDVIVLVDAPRRAPRAADHAARHPARRRDAHDRRADARRAQARARRFHHRQRQRPARALAPRRRRLGALEARRHRRRATLALIAPRFA